MSTNNYRQLMWVIPLLLEDGPRTFGDIVRTTGWSKRDAEDAIYECVQEGVIRMRNDSKLEKL